MSMKQEGLIERLSLENKKNIHSMVRICYKETLRKERKNLGSC